MKKRQLTRLLIFLATLLFVATGTILMIRYAKGYRPTMQGTIKGTGLLAANSFPSGAELYVNDRLRSATDTTINLDPGSYDVVIKKDGYFPWTKKLEIQEELVTQTNATLFPMSPTLSPLTLTGAINPIPSPDGNRIVFAVASASASTKNGLYVQDLASTPISFNRSARQIARAASGYDYTESSYTWSPNRSQILVTFSPNKNIILESDRFNDLATIQDISTSLPTTLQDWEQELIREDKIKYAKLPTFFQQALSDTKTATASANKLGNYYPSPDGEKLLYQALTNTSLPQGILPSLPSSSTQPENRELQAGSWYVYDLKEDKNFLVGSGTIASSSEEANFLLEKLPLFTDIKDATSTSGLNSSTPSGLQLLTDELSISESIQLFNAQYAPIYLTNVQWYPDSYHLILTLQDHIEIVEYDRGNRTTLYAGPFDNKFVYPWPDGSKIITLIQFNPDTIPNLYTIKLK